MNFPRERGDEGERERGVDRGDNLLREKSEWGGKMKGFVWEEFLQKVLFLVTLPFSFPFSFLSLPPPNAGGGKDLENEISRVGDHGPQFKDQGWLLRGVRTQACRCR